MNTQELTQFSEAWMASVGELEQAEGLGRLAEAEDARETQATLLRQLVARLANADSEDRPQMARLILAARIVSRIRALPAGARPGAIT
jgi:hypothetical protein